MEDVLFLRGVSSQAQGLNETIFQCEQQEYFGTSSRPLPQSGRGGEKDPKQSAAVVLCAEVAG